MITCFCGGLKPKSTLRVVLFLNCFCALTHVFENTVNEASQFEILKQYILNHKGSQIQRYSGKYHEKKAGAQITIGGKGVKNITD